MATLKDLEDVRRRVSWGLDTFHASTELREQAATLIMNAGEAAALELGLSAMGDLDDVPESSILGERSTEAIAALEEFLQKL